MTTLEDRFGSRVSAFLAGSGLSPAAFGMRAVGDPNLVRRIKRGRSPSLRTADRVLAFISDYDEAFRGARDPPPHRGTPDDRRTREAEPRGAER